jgi:hypothetical protein
MTKTLLAWTDPGGQGQVSPAGCAILAGITEAEVAEVWNPMTNAPFSMPPAWQESMNANVARARDAGATSAGPILMWLAWADLGCTTEVDAGGQLWLISDDGDD